MTDPVSIAVKTDAIYNVAAYTTLPGAGAFQFETPIGFWLRNEDRRTYLAVTARDTAADLRRRLRAIAGETTSTVKLIAAGDSITVGGNSADGTGYRGWLVDLMDRRHDITADVVLAGANGLNLDGVTPHVASAVAANPDALAVLLHIGTNDALAGNLNTWKSRYLALIDQTLAANPTVKVVCSRLIIASQIAENVRASGYTIPTGQNTINGHISSAVAARQATGRVALADMSVIPPAWLTDGGWHPGDAGYARMASIWLAAIKGWF